MEKTKDFPSNVFIGCWKKYKIRRYSVLRLSLISAIITLLAATILPGQVRKIGMHRYENILFLSMVQDEQGYIWGGGFKTGLIRFDGQEFKYYYANPGVPDSLWGATISRIVEADNGDLWLASEAGLHLYDRTFDHFENFPLDSSCIINQGGYARAVTFIYEDTHGNLWTMGDQFQLHRWDRETMRSHLFTTKATDQNPVFVQTVINGKPSPAFLEDAGAKLWIGLAKGGGLLHYDPQTGVEKLYRHDPKMPNSLPDDQIMSLYVDPEGVLWLGAANQGLYRFDAGNDTFTRIPSSAARTEEGLEAAIYQIAPDTAGLLWVVRPSLIQQFDRYDQSWRTVYQITDFNPPPGTDVITGTLPSHGGFRYVGPGKEGWTWFSNTGEFIRAYGYNRAEDAIHPYWFDFPDRSEVKSYLMGIVGIDRTGLVWVGYGSGMGILRQDPVRERFTVFATPERNEEEESTDWYPYPSAGVEDPAGNIWLNSGGLAQYHPPTNSLNRLESLSNFYPTDILADDQGRLWLGGRNGATRLDFPDQEYYLGNLALGKPVSASTVAPAPIYFPPVFAVDGDPKTDWASASGGAQWLTIDLEREHAIGRIVLYWNANLGKYDFRYQIQVSADGQAWQSAITDAISPNNVRRELNLNISARYIRIYSDSPALKAEAMSLWEVEIYPPLPKTRHYQWTPAGAPVNLDHVEDIHQDQNGVIWVASQDGLGRFDEQVDQFVFFRPLPELRHRTANYITKILEDREGKLWLLPRNQNLLSGLLVFDPGDETFTKMPSDSLLPQPRNIAQDRDGAIWWIGTGLAARYDHTAGKFEPMLKIDTRDADFDFFLHDSYGNFWITEFHNGIHFLASDGQHTHYTPSNGLPSLQTAHIREDRQGNIWIDQWTGLTRFDPSTKTFTYFGEEDGLLTTKGVTNLSIDSQGRLYWVTEAGINTFHPANILPDPYPPQVEITDLFLFGQPIQPGDNSGILNQLLSKTERITLAYDQNALSFNYIGLHYADPENITYQIRMEGMNKEWVDRGNQTSVDYPGLPPGRFTFQVRAANPDGLWSKPASIEVRIRPPWWESTAAYIFYGLIILSVLWLIRRAEKSKQERELRHEQEKLAQERIVNERLRELDKLKDMFLANTSHELRTPLHGIIGIAESIFEMPEKKSPEELKENLGMIIASSRRLSSLVNDLLDFSRVKNHDLQLQTKSVGLHAVADIVLRTCYPLVGMAPIELRNKIPTDVAVLADENRLQQVLYNLVGNAIKFTESGFVEVGCEEKENDQIRIYIKDTGIGIPEEKRGAIFQAFEQAENPDSRQFAGTGLGLSISKQLVELQGGELWVDSAVGQGSTFYFTLPVSDQPTKIKLAETPAVLKMPPLATPSVMATVQQLKQNLSTDAKGLRVLIVDDEPINHQVLKNYLEDQNFLITSVMNGEEAIKTIDSGVHFDLVLLDVMMPRISGYEVCQKIREKFLPSELPVVMVTAKNQVQDLVQGLNLGANDYLTKPFSRDEFLARVKTQINLHRINEATAKFIPSAFLKSLGRDNITEVQLGDQVHRTVTVSFADIRDYTSLSETMTPEDNFRFVTEYNRRLGPIIQQHNGFINQYLGDAIMSIFLESPEDAIRAAIDMHQALQEYNAGRLKQGQPAIQAGIGLHTGPLIMGIIGDEKRMDAATIADTVNTASRIENLTKHYGVNILVSEDSLKKVRESDGKGSVFNLRYLGKVIVKGKEKPTGLYECFDGDAPEVIERKLKTQSFFEEGLNHYLYRSFTRASLSFEEVLKVAPGDATAKLFLTKSAHYIANGVPEEWTGVEVMRFK